MGRAALVDPRPGASASSRSPGKDWNDHQKSSARALSSLRPLTDTAPLAAQPARLAMSPAPAVR